VATETRLDSDPIPPLDVPESPRGGTANSSGPGRRAADGSLLADRVKSLQLPPEVTADGHSGLLKWVICALALLAAVLIGANLLHRIGDENKSAGATSTTGSSATPAVDPAAADVVLESKGYIVPVHEILVSPKIAGMVLKLNIIEGKHVEKGTVLAELESVDYKAEMDRAKATLDGMKQKLLELEHGSRKEEIEEAAAELAEAKAQLMQLKSTWERMKKLHDLGTKAVTDNDYDISESLYLAGQRRVERLTSAFELMKIGPRKEKIDAARADVELATADYDKAVWRFDNCTVRAPVSGTILQKNAEEGNIVNPIVFNGSYSICKMANLADLEVDLNIQERDVANVFVGQHCKVHTDAYPDRIYNGNVSRLMPIADRAKGAIPVRVKLEIPAAEEGIYLKPEMGAVVSFYKKKT
jgi:multidrug resistance efflux pump